MATKQSSITGLDFKKFYLTDSAKFWPDGWIVDDIELSVNGEPNNCDDPEKIKDADVVDIIAGYVFNENGDGVGSLRAHYRNWLKDQTTKTFLVQVPAEKVDEVKAAVKAAGGTVV